MKNKIICTYNIEIKSIIPLNDNLIVHYLYYHSITLLQKNGVIEKSRVERAKVDNCILY